MIPFLIVGFLAAIFLAVAATAIVVFLVVCVRAVAAVRLVLRELRDRPRAAARNRWRAALRRWW